MKKIGSLDVTKPLGSFEEEKAGILDEIHSIESPWIQDLPVPARLAEAVARRGLVHHFAEVWLPYLNAAGLVQEDTEDYRPRRRLSWGLTGSDLWAPLWAIAYLRYALLGGPVRLIKDVAKELMAMSGNLDAIIVHMAAAVLAKDQHTRRIAQKALHWAMECKRAGEGYPLPVGTLGARPGSPKEDNE